MNRSFLYKPQQFLANCFTPITINFDYATSLKKNANVETLRGIAIILVVFGHIIGSTSTGGMKVADDSIFRYLYFTLEYIRMPLFTVISGWVYANKPVVLSDRGKFLCGKLRRLLMPMFVMSTLLFLFRMVIPGTNTKPELAAIPYNLVFPYDLYWFLYSLFLIFLVIILIDTQPFFHKLEGWLTVLVSSFVVLAFTKMFLEEVPNVFSFKGAVYLFPFFLTGIGFQRYKDVIFTRRNSFIFLCLFITGMIIQQAVWFGVFPDQSKQSFLGLTVGLASVFLLFNLKFKSRLLMWIGSYAYGIFLFHVFFTGGTRIVLLRAGIENKWVILFAGLCLSILLPIIIETLIKRSSVLRFCLLGLKKNEG